VRIMGSGRVRGRIWPQGAGTVGQFGLPDVIHCAGALGISALGGEAELGSLARVHPFRQRLRNAGVGKGAEIGSLTLAYPFRWLLTNAGE
jgi:hypothetical protein